MPDDPLSSALGEIRERSERPLGPSAMALPISIPAVQGLLESAADVPRLLAALDAVLKAHRNADGRCAWCRNPDGQRQKWPCGEYLVITRELTGGGWR
jgi:hypothetical protein